MEVAASGCRMAQLAMVPAGAELMGSASAVRCAAGLGWCLLLGFSGGLVAAQAQEAQVAPSVPTVKSRSRNVILDVVVTDARGQPVRGLSADEFTITENGTPQKIRLVDTAGEGGAAAPADAAREPLRQTETQPPGPGRPSGGTRTVILLDEVNVQFFDLAFARQRLEAFLRSDKAAGQPIAIMTMSKQATALVHDFTTDRATLVKAVHAIPAVLTATGEGGQINGNVDFLGEMENFRRAVGVLEQLSSALKGTTDHINVLWITSGFPGLTQTVVSGDVQSTLDRLLRGTSNLFLEARLTLYTIDPHGVQIESSLPNHNGQIFQGSGSGATNINTGEELEGNVLNLSNTQAVANSMLGKLDQRTGGRMYGNMNDIDVPIAMAIEEGSSAYRVAYSPSDKNFDGRYRKIHVKVSRPGLVARTRDGYFALAEPAAPSREDRKLRLEEALESPFPYEGLRVSGTLSGTAARAAVDVTVEPAGLTRTFEAGGTRRKVLVAMAAYSAGNRVLGSQVWEVEAKNGKGEEGAVRYSLPYPLPAGTARLRVAVLDANSDRVGTSEVALRSGSGGS